MENTVHTLSIIFDTKISSSEVPLFRGAVLHSITQGIDVLFHNHEQEGNRYSYPLIQYKRIKGQAAIICIEEGVCSIEKFLTDSSFDFILGKKSYHLEIDKIQPRKNELTIRKEYQSYSIERWVPLNSDNYRIFKSTESLVERLTMLERILKGNILSMAKSLDIILDQEIDLFIIEYNKPMNEQIKGNSIMTFNLKFKCNVTLPDYIGLGKHASIGFGVIEILN